MPQPVHPLAPIQCLRFKGVEELLAYDPVESGVASQVSSCPLKTGVVPRSQLQFDSESDYQPPKRRRQAAKRLSKPLVDAEAGVEGDASAEEKSDTDN